MTVLHFTKLNAGHDRSARREKNDFSYFCASVAFVFTSSTSPLSHSSRSLVIVEITTPKQHLNLLHACPHNHFSFEIISFFFVLIFCCFASRVRHIIQTNLFIYRVNATRNQIFIIYSGDARHSAILPLLRLSRSLPRNGINIYAECR